MKHASVIREVKLAAREKFAWPGGYPLVVVMTDGACLCCDCARQNFAQIGRATRDGLRDGWAAAGVDAHMQGAPEICAHCGVEIPSAYGDPEGGQ